MKKSFLLLVLLCNAQCYGRSEHFLSFIMPCYNSATTIRKSIDCIYAQNIQTPFEVICTDDASADNTLEILREYECKHANFHVYIHTQNKGGGAASNTCIINSKGDLIFRLDSDNILASDTIDRLVDLLDSTKCDGASVQELRFFTGNFIHLSSWHYIAPNNICDLHHGIAKIEAPINSGNYLFTRKSFNRAGGYPEQHGSDTFCFGFKQLATGSKIAILPNSYYWHFINPNGYWMREKENGKNYKMALDTLKEFSEVFSEATIAYLNSFHSGNPFNDFGNGKITLAPIPILNHLFAGHVYKENGDPQKAIYEFEQAMILGCKSQKIYRIINELKEKI